MLTGGLFRTLVWNPALSLVLRGQLRGFSAARRTGDVAGGLAVRPFPT